MTAAPVDTTIEDCILAQLPRIPDRRGNLTVIEALEHVPFPIERAYWIYDVPGGEERGGHAYRTLEEFVVALSGSFDVVLDDAVATRTIRLSRSYFGVYVPPMVWRGFADFSTNAVCLVLASQHYAEADYIRGYEAFAAEKVRR